VPLPPTVYPTPCNRKVTNKKWYGQNRTCRTCRTDRAGRTLAQSSCLLADAQIVAFILRLHWQ